MQTPNPDQQKFVEMLQASGEAVEKSQNNLSLLNLGLIAFLFLFVVSVIFYYSLLNDVLTRKFRSPVENLVWLIAFLSFPIIGPIFYMRYIRNSVKRASKTKKRTRRKR